MNTWKVILATLVIFGTGVLTGGLLVTYSHSVLRPPRKPSFADAQRGIAAATNAPAVRENRQSPPPNAPFRKDFVDRLNRELKLSPEQREHIERIVTEGQERTKELWRIEWVAARQRIRMELKPDQQIHFEELLRARPHEQRRPPPHDRLTTNTLGPVISSNPPAAR